jgi:hypothetical protein
MIPMNIDVTVNVNLASAKDVVKLKAQLSHIQALLQGLMESTVDADKLREVTATIDAKAAALRSAVDDSAL